MKFLFKKLEKERQRHIIVIVVVAAIVVRGITGLRVAAIYDLELVRAVEESLVVENPHTDPVHPQGSVLRDHYVIVAH